MFNGKTVSCVILAAGNSIRMGLDKNKVYCEIKGGYVVEYSIREFEKHEYIDDIYIVIRQEDEHFLCKLLCDMTIGKPTHIVQGGEFRCQSVYNAIKNIDSDYVIIHDGARPFIRETYITNCVKSMTNCKGSAIGTKNTEILRTVSNNVITGDKEKQILFQVQTPQCFHTDILKECYEKLENPQLATDDSYLLENSGYKVKIIEGDKRNIKITTTHDILIASSYFDKYSKSNLI